MLAQNFKSPKDLDLPDEEFDAHVKVLGMLERGELKHYDLHSDVEETGNFNMGVPVYSASCGTVACIGGHVGLTMGLSGKECGAYIDDAERGQERLYYADGFSLDAITTDQAAQALRNYLTTGEPQWEEVLA